MTTYFTREHEWIKVDGDTATIGITDHAQEALGDIVFTEVPEAGKQLNKGQEAAVVESVKAASEVYAPVGGEVIAVNERLAGEPELVNAEPTGNGWMFKMKDVISADMDGLLDEAAYSALTASDEEH